MELVEWQNRSATCAHICLVALKAGSWNGELWLHPHLPCQEPGRESRSAPNLLDMASIAFVASGARNFRLRNEVLKLQSERWAAVAMQEHWHQAERFHRRVSADDGAPCWPQTDERFHRRVLGPDALALIGF